MLRAIALAFCAAVATATYAADPLETNLPDAAVGSDDPHVLLLGAVWSTASDERLAFLERAAELASDDPVVLVQVLDHCQKELAQTDFCAGRDWDLALADADPENGAPLIALAARASVGGDRDEVIAQLREAATRPYHDGYFGRSALAYYRALHRLAPAGRSFDELAVAQQALGVAAAVTGLEGGLVIACMSMRDDRDLRTACRKVAGQIVEHPFSMSAALMAAGLLKRMPDLSDTERARIAEVDRVVADAQRLVADREAQWREDPTRIEETMEAMGRHGEYIAWQ